MIYDEVVDEYGFDPLDQQTEWRWVPWLGLGEDAEADEGE